MGSPAQRLTPSPAVDETTDVVALAVPRGAVEADGVELVDTAVVTRWLETSNPLPTGDDAIVFEGTAEEAIRFLEGEHADETIAALRSEGLLCASSG